MLSHGLLNYGLWSNRGVGALIGRLARSARPQILVKKQQKKHGAELRLPVKPNVFSGLKMDHLAEFEPGLFEYKILVMLFLNAQLASASCKRRAAICPI